jgi:hypothetical protein
VHMFQLWAGMCAERWQLYAEVLPPLVGGGIAPCMRIPIRAYAHIGACPYMGMPVNSARVRIA